MSKLITRKFIAGEIDKLLQKKISIREFGEEMFRYQAFENDEYQYEAGYEELIKEILTEFMDMHDADKADVGYEPYIPAPGNLTRIKARLLE